MAMLDVALDVFLGTWTSAKQYLRNTAAVSITRGRPDARSTLSPAAAAFTLDNRDGRWAFRNPASPWYGELVQSTPLRVSLPSSLAGLPCYLRLETDTASYVSAPDSSSVPVHITSGSASAASGLTVTIPSTTAGNTLVVGVYVGGDSALQTVSTVKLGTSSLSVVKADNNGAFSDSEIWLLSGIAAGQTSVVITPTGTSELAATVYEIPGLAASPSDQTAGATGATNAWSSGSTSTLSQANEIAIGMVGGPFGGGGATLTGPPSPWVNTSTISIGGTLKNVAMSGYNVLDATTGLAYTGTSSASGNSVAVIATFKATGNNLGVTTGTLSVRADVLMTDNRQCTIVSKWGASAQAWVLVLGTQLTSDGHLQFYHWDGTNAHSSASDLPLPYFTGRIAVRADYNIGAQTITFYTAPNMSGAWTQLGGVKTTPATSQSAGAGQAVQIGAVLSSVNSAGSWNANASMLGQVYEVQVLSSGSLLGDPVFTSQTPGATSFTDSQGNTWTLNGTAELSGRLYRFHGELASLAKAADPSSRNASVAAQAGGVMRRLSQQQSPADSPLTRAYLRLPSNLQLAGYWPCEDGTGANTLQSRIGGIDGEYSPAVTLASSSAFVASAPIPVMNGGTMSFTVPSGNVTWTDNVVRFLWALPSGDDTSGTAACIIYTNGTVARLELVYTTGGNLQLLGYNATGSQIITGNVVTYGLAKMAMCRVSVELTTEGGNFFQVWVLPPDGSATGISSGNTWVGSIGAVTSVSFGYGLVGSAIGQVSVQGVSDGINDLSQPLNAWLGETAGARIARLCSEENLNCRIIGPPDLSQPMGYQTEETIPELLQECETTDMGMLFEPLQTVGVGYVTNWALCQQPVAATADFSQREIDPAWSPVSDDTIVINDVTMTALTSSSSSSSVGASYRATLTTGPMSTASPPAGVGRFDTEVTVNPEQASQLPNLAGWYLHVMTANEDRYPSIPFQLARGNIPQAITLLDIGSYLQVVNPPYWTATGPERQLVAGWTETIGPQPMWTLALNGVPEAPYEVGIVGDAVYGHADTDGSTLTAAITSSATSMLVTTGTGFALWTTAAGDFPFDVMMGGEQVTVGAITGPGVLAGADQISPGALTVTPQATGSWVYGAVVNGTNSTSFTANASTTFSQNVSDVTNTAAYGTFRTTSATTAGTPVTVGASAPAVASAAAVVEILAFGGSLSEDATSPAGVHTTAAKTITTASFTPPAGSLLVAMVASDGNGFGNQITMTVTNTGPALTWTLAAGDPVSLATVWVAPVTTSAATTVTATSSGANSSNGIILTVKVVDNTAGAGNQIFSSLTRSVNGVVKAQAAGTDIRLAHPMTVSL